MSHIQKLFTIILMLLIITAAAERTAVGQEEDSTWTDPTNLSSSGSAIEPRMAIDSRGATHAFWQDEAVGSFFYSLGVSDNWTSPERVEVPFGTRATFPELDEEQAVPLFDPHLLADPDGQLHAFWLDDLNSLFHSQVAISNITNFESWSSPVLLAESAADFSAAVDAQSDLKLAYIYNESGGAAPAGVYHQRLDNGASEWSDPTLLYRSAYLQDLPSEQSNIQLAIGSQGQGDTIFVVWDNRPEERVFLARSPDGGQSWDDAQIIDQRRSEDAPSTAGPSNIQIAAGAGSTLLVWQAGHEFDICSQYYQSSEDGGQSWQEPSLMLETFTNCPESSSFVGHGGDLTLLHTFIQNNDYLLAWDNERWSSHQPQGFSDFTHPDTFRIIDLGCHQLGIRSADRFQMVGCGLDSEGLRADIWATSRVVGQTSDWFPEESAWSEPAAIAGDIPVLTNPQILADGVGRWHTFWLQPTIDTTLKREIYYARQQDGQWTPTVRVIGAEADNITHFRGAFAPNDRLLMAWVEDSGTAYFSKTSADQAILRADWSTPVQIPAPELAISDLDIAVNRQGDIFIAYTIPFNESRGVYLTSSGDEGRSWREPVVVFDGVAAEWQMVGPPQLAVSDNGALSVMFTNQSFDPGGGQVQADSLHYSRSIDGGITFQEPLEVHETTVIWNDLLDSGDALHRLWQQSTELGGSVFHQYSLDHGQSWSSRALIVSSLNPVSLTVDEAGQLHLVEIAGDVLKHYGWNGATWHQEQNVRLPIDDGERSLSTEVSATVDPDQRLSVIFSGETIEAGQDQSDTILFSVWRALEPVDGPIAITPVDTAPALLPTTPPAEATASLEPTPSQSPPTPATPGGEAESVNTQPVDDSGLINFDNPIVRWAVVIVPVLILLLVVIGIVIWSYRSARS